MNPLIQHTETSDGVRIAYYTMGRGVPFVATSMLLWGHLGNTLVFKEHYRSHSPGGLGRGMQVVRYDARGTGLSDRDAIDFSIEAQTLDLEAVLRALALERFALFGRIAGCPLAMTYAAKHPERVSHLILAEPLARAGDLPAAPAMVGMEPSRSMSPDQWEAFTLALASVSMGYSSPSLARSVARNYRDAMTPASHAAYHEWRTSFDASACLGEIQAPTLILSPRRPHYPSVANQVASSIAGARILTVAADLVISGRWLPAETEAVEEFLGLAPARAAPAIEDKAADAPRHLTRREMEVLALVVAGRSNREIAGNLSLSERTVARHIANMYEKLSLHGRAEITAYAVRHGLV